eukprot:2235685-Amphidinium_carterae.1
MVIIWVRWQCLITSNQISQTSSVISAAQYNQIERNMRVGHTLLKSLRVVISTVSAMISYTLVQLSCYRTVHQKVELQSMTKVSIH